MTKISGDKDSVFGYTGHMWHAQSGLNLTLFRAYDPNLGRWINRDPIGEDGGQNIYAYTENKPINGVDPLGLDGVYVWFPQGGAVGHASAEVDGTYYSLWPQHGGLQVAQGSGPGAWRDWGWDTGENGENRPPDVYIPLDGPNYPNPDKIPTPDGAAPPWGAGENDCADEAFSRLKKKYPKLKKDHKRKKRTWEEFFEPGVNGPIYYPADLESDVLDHLIYGWGN